MWFLQSHFFSLILIVPLPQFRNSVLKIESLFSLLLSRGQCLCAMSFTMGKLKHIMKK